MVKKPDDHSVSQLDKFKKAAREADTDPSEERFDQVLKKVAKKAEAATPGKKTVEP